MTDCTSMLCIYNFTTTRLAERLWLLKPAGLTRRGSICSILKATGLASCGPALPPLFLPLFLSSPSVSLPPSVSSLPERVVKHSCILISPQLPSSVLHVCSPLALCSGTRGWILRSVWTNVDKIWIGNQLVLTVTGGMIICREVAACCVSVCVCVCVCVSVCVCVCWLTAHHPAVSPTTLMRKRRHWERERERWHQNTDISTVWGLQYM